MRPEIAIPATLALIHRAYKRKSLTLPAIIAAALTATIHALHPSPLPFTLLVVFFLLGTNATKTKHEYKATLTVSSTGSSGGEGSRTTTQVLANSGAASLLVLLHIFNFGTSQTHDGHTLCFGKTPTGVIATPSTASYPLSTLILAGIIANYAAVTSDTLSSELGILSRSPPRLITAPWKHVPRGTNGGVTTTGLIAGATGSLVIGVVSSFLLPPACAPLSSPSPSPRTRLVVILLTTIWGALGSVLDSLLGALVQASVVDTRTGKVVEGAGGLKVLTGGGGGNGVDDGGKEKKASRRINSGRDLLDNNQVNFVMALAMSMGGMVAVSYL